MCLNLIKIKIKAKKCLSFRLSQSISKKPSQENNQRYRFMFTEMIFILGKKGKN